jgi:putative endonuclease
MWWPWKKTKELPEHLKTGEWGEDQAARFLKRKGFKILGRRVRLDRDELDIVARHGGVLVFVEVKTRKNEEFGRAVSAVNRGKRASLSRGAFHYLRRLREKPDFFRFDVIEVIGEKEKGDPEIRHIENAFNLDSKYRITW